MWGRHGGTEPFLSLQDRRERRGQARLPPTLCLAAIGDQTRLTDTPCEEAPPLETTDLRGAEDGLRNISGFNSRNTVPKTGLAVYQVFFPKPLNAKIFSISLSNSWLSCA